MTPYIIYETIAIKCDGCKQRGAECQPVILKYKL